MLARNLTIALLLLARVAAATPAAEKLFQDGLAAMAANHLDEACDSFRRSEELEPRVGTLYQLGECEEKRKRVASAWAAFVEAKSLAASLKDKRGAKIDKRAADLVPRLPYLLLAVKPVAGLQITRDGVAVPAAEWDHEVPLDPRHYKLEATAPGRVAWTSEVDIVEGQHLKVEVPELAAVAVVVPVDKPIDKPVDKPIDKPIDKPVDPPIGTPVPASTVLPFAYRIGVGVLVGLGNDADALFGVRLVANAAPLGPGWIRLVPVFRRWSGSFPGDPYKTYDTYGFGATVEYVMPATANIFVAAGLGLGVELQHDANMVSPPLPRLTLYVPAVRVSPTLHYDRFDLSVSYELGRGPSHTGDGSVDRFVELSHRVEVALDFFVW